MNIRHYIVLTIPLLSQIILGSENLKTIYIANPNPKDCGAAVSKSRLRYDNINQALACMQKGYRNVCWMRETDTSDLNQQLNPYFQTLGKLEFFLTPRTNPTKDLILYPSCYLEVH